MLLGTEFVKLATNSFDYWENASFTSSALSLAEVEHKLDNLETGKDTCLQIYVQVPFCTQKCSFCTLSGGHEVQIDEALNYVSYVKKQLNDIFLRTNMQGVSIDSIHIGGGSPELLGNGLSNLLSYLTSLDGFTNSTELSIELPLFGLRKKTVALIKKYPVKKISFGVQTLIPRIREYLRMPLNLRRMDETFSELRRHIPVLNVDLMIGLPTQTLDDVVSDIDKFIHHPAINSISINVFNPNSSTQKYLADVMLGDIPPSPSEVHLANMRLYSYSTLISHGWKRLGKNTYVAVPDTSDKGSALIRGNACIGVHNYDDYLVGIGPSAVSCFPGLRIENKRNLRKWKTDIDNSALPYDLLNCTERKNQGETLWNDLLIHRGLRKEKLEQLISSNQISSQQVFTFNNYITQGLIILNIQGVYQLTIIGEVFKEQLLAGLR